MNLHFNKSKAYSYVSKSQIARVLSEDWVKINGYCPNCGEDHLTPFENNRPVADFYCDKCDEEYELKSKKGKKLGNIIAAGAYSKMISRIQSQNNPHFFFLTHEHFTVNNFLAIPNYFFTPAIIKKRKPLSSTARRPGWIGCNILLDKIPELGRVFIVKNSVIIPKDIVLRKWKSTAFLKTKNEDVKGWLLDILICIDTLKKDNFSLKDIYSFEHDLALKHPDNHFIKEKIRQQIQVLRDQGMIEFLGGGKYRRINYRL